MKTPYPDVIPRQHDSDVPWTVERGPGSVDLTNHVMQVPLDDWLCPCGHNHSEATRRHEMGHVAFTPLDGYERGMSEEIAPLFVNAAEDVRIANRMAAINMPVGPGMCPEMIKRGMSRLLAAKQYDELVAAIASSWASQESGEAVTDWFQGLDSREVPERDALSGVLSWAWRLYTQRMPLFSDTLKIARELQAIAKRLRGDEQERQEQQQREQQEGERKKERRDKAMRVPKHGDPAMVDADGRWGKMTVETAPLTLPARVMPTRKWTARDEGVVPSAIYRYAVDGRIFKQSAHRGGGYVLLVDCSGSMQWQERDLKALLETAPATTVALYSGSDFAGKLRIVAHKGKRAAREWIKPPYGGNNLIDGPALEWLGHQKGRHVWLSDGKVTGLPGGRPYAHSPRIYSNLAKITRDIVTKYNVMRVESADEAIAVIAGKESFRPSTRQEACPYLGD